MLEIALIAVCCRFIGKVLGKKGRNPLAYQTLFVVAWLVGEVTGAVLGVQLLSRDGPLSRDDTLAAAIIGGLLGVASVVTGMFCLVGFLPSRRPVRFAAIIVPERLSQPRTAAVQRCQRQGESPTVSACISFAGGGAAAASHAVFPPQRASVRPGQARSKASAVSEANVRAEPTQERQPLSWWDRQFGRFGFVAKFLLPLLCNGLALLLGIVGVLVCQERQARENARWMVLFSSIVTGFGALLLLFLVALARDHYRLTKAVAASERRAIVRPAESNLGPRREARSEAQPNAAGVKTPPVPSRPAAADAAVKQPPARPQAALTPTIHVPLLPPVRIPPVLVPSPVASPPVVPRPPSVSESPGSVPASSAAPQLPGDFAFLWLTQLDQPTDISRQIMKGPVTFKFQAEGQELMLKSGSDRVCGLQGKGLSIQQQNEGIGTIVSGALAPLESEKATSGRKSSRGDKRHAALGIRLHLMWTPHPFACYHGGQLLGIWDPQSKRLRTAAANEASAFFPGDEEVPKGESPAFRRWASADSKHSTEAKFLKFQNSRVHLEKHDGTVVQVSMHSLSADDQQYVRDVLRQQRTR